ncbi:MAG: hypothetical protein WCG20_01870 [bacterium]
MKKTIFNGFMVMIIAAMLQSCAQHHVVTVIGLHQNNTVSDHVITAGTIGTPLCDVVTNSGDTITARVPRKVLLEHKMPFKADMVKSDEAKYGYVQRAIGSQANTKQLQKASL